MRRLSSLLLVLGLLGCVATGTKVTEAQLGQFQIGSTRYADVVQALGPPNQSTLKSDGSREAIYTYTQAQVHAVNFIPVAGAFLGGQRSEQTSVLLVFDAQQILQQYSATQGQTAIGTGLTSGSRQ